MDTTYDIDWDSFESAMNTTTTSASSAEAEGIMAALLGMGITLYIIIIAVAILSIVSFWKIFTKAGKPGWAALIPIYNIWVLCEVAGLPGWVGLLSFIPFIAPIIPIIIAIKLPAQFGKDAVYAAGLIFLGVIFYPMLAFGKAEYVGETSTASNEE